MGKVKKIITNALLAKLLNWLWQIPLLLVLLLLICIGFGTLFPIGLGVVWIVIICISLFGKIDHLDDSRPMLIFYAIISIFVFLGAIAPFRAVCLLIVQEFPQFTMLANFWIAWIQHYTDIVYIAYMDFFLGLSVAAIAFVVYLQDFMWRMVQLRQIKVLPKSTARAAAQGMVKIEGIVEPIVKDKGPIVINAYTTSDGDTTSTYVDKFPFYVKDKTGKVLVDPKYAVVVGGEVAYESAEKQSFLDMRACEIILTKRAPKLSNHLNSYQLMAGDKVTLFGTAKANKHFNSKSLGNEAEVLIKASKTNLSKFKFHDVFLLVSDHGIDLKNAFTRRTKSNFIGMILLVGLALLLALFGFHGIYDFNNYYYPEHLAKLYQN